MSRGLGRRQRLFLATLVDLERQNGPIGGYYRTSQVVRRAFDLAADLRAAADTQVSNRVATFARLRTAAATDDEFARYKFVLGAAFARGSKQMDHSRGGVAIERAVNPSRVIALLANRGLVRRRHGRIALTDIGRAAVNVEQADKSLE
jgi:hypothetical protein